MADPNALDIAGELRGRATNHHGYRAAISRAYYAAFQHVRDHPTVRAAGFAPDRGPRVHSDLIAFLRRSGERHLKQVGRDYLDALRKSRNHADYDLHWPVTPAMADEALDLAADVIHELLPA